MTITSTVDFGEAQTGVGYQAFGASGSLGARVTSGITNPSGGVYVAAVNAPAGTLFIQWSCDNASLTCNDGDLFLRNGDAFNAVLTSAGVQAIWDAATSALTTAGSIGKRLLDFVTTLVYAAPSTPPTAGAIAAQVDATLSTAHGNGAWGGVGLSGPSSVTLTFHDENAAVVPNVDFTILGQGSARSLSNGTAAFGLPDGSYTVAARATGGVVFTNSTLTVAGTTLLTITGATVQISAPPDPACTTAFLDVYDSDYLLAPWVPFDFELVTAPSGSSGKSYPHGFTRLSGANGRLSLPLLKGAAYRARRGRDGAWVVFTAGSSGSYAIPVTLGTP